MYNINKLEVLPTGMINIHHWMLTSGNEVIVTQEMFDELLDESFVDETGYWEGTTRELLALAIGLDYV